MAPTAAEPPAEGPVDPIDLTDPVDPADPGEPTEPAGPGPRSSPHVVRQWARDLRRPRRMMSRLWGRRAFWQVRVRWSVPALLAILALVGPRVGVGIPVVPILVLAAIVLGYNLPFALVSHRAAALRDEAYARDRFYVVLQVALDYGAMLGVVHFTGGIASPLAPLFVLHVVTAAILFRPSTAYLFAGAALAGMAGLAVAERTGLVASRPLVVAGAPLPGPESVAHVAVALVALGFTLFAAAALGNRVMARLRRGVRRVGRVTEEVALLNDRLNSLYTMVQAVGRERRLGPVLALVTSELAAVLDVAGVTVKLLDADGRTLRYVAAHGFPPGFGAEGVVHLDRSPLNRQVIEERVVHLGRVSDEDDFQRRDELTQLGITWVMFAPLVVEERVIGVVGAYRRDPAGFEASDGDFLQLAAGLVAVAIEDARTNEEISGLMQERSRFTLQVAHNLRAPLGAAIGMLETVTGGYLGEIPPESRETLDRTERRLRALNDTVGELLTLARTGDRSRPTESVMIDLGALAAQIDRTWGPRAAEQGLAWTVSAEPHMPFVRGDPEMLEQILENLVSNALKYTPDGGSVGVRFRPDGPGRVVLEVEDTGIGIPRGERRHLFEEFFRASNARRLRADGTGLGLAIVKRTVERLGGRLDVDTEEGRGTRVSAELPAAAP